MSDNQSRNPNPSVQKRKRKATSTRKCCPDEDRKINEQLNLELIAELIEKYDKPKRARQLSTLEAITAIMFMIQTGLSYRQMNNCTFLKNVGPDALRKRFKMWVELGIPQKVWHDITTFYMSEKIKTDETAFKNIFIDATLVKNDCGEDCVGRNPTDRGRKGSKISLCCSSDMVAIGFSFTGANRHDITEVENVINSIPAPLKTDNRRSNNLIADKAYASETVKKNLWNNMKLRIVRENKKTKKNPNPDPLSKQDQALIRKRFIIENFFGALKKTYNRFRLRKERFLNNFKGMFYLAVSMMSLSQMRLIMSDGTFKKLKNAQLSRDAI